MPCSTRAFTSGLVSGSGTVVPGKTNPAGVRPTVCPAIETPSTFSSDFRFGSEPTPSTTLAAAKRLPIRSTPAAEKDSIELVASDVVAPVAWLCDDEALALAVPTDAPSPPSPPAAALAVDDDSVL